jgi:hypothetical protein
MIKLTYKSNSRIKTTEKQALPSVQPETETLVETVLSASKVPLAAGASAPSGESGPPPHQVIKLGIDVHLDRYVKGSVHEIVTFFTRSLKQGVRP